MKESSPLAPSSAGRKANLFLLALSVVAWCILWVVFIDGIAAFSIILFPVWIIVLVVSLLAPQSKRPGFPIFMWSSVLALVLLFTMTWLASFPLTRTTTYYLGVDIELPGGVLSSKSMVQSTTYALPSMLKPFSFKHSTVKGEAIFCDLGNGKNLLVTLAFAKDPYGTRTLRELPWIAAGLNNGDEGYMTSPVTGHYDLKEDQFPILISFPDINSLQSILHVVPNEMENLFGPGYSIKSVWVEVTETPYQSFGIREHIKWLNSVDANGLSAYKKAFLKIGFGGVSNPFELVAD